MTMTKHALLARLAGATALVTAPLALQAAEVEVTHWWTSGGEAAAVAELAHAFEAQTENTWVDGAIAGSGGVARPVIISRILGGDPMGATQLNHGQQAAELVEAGLMLDLTELAEQENWAEIIRPASLLEACTLDGRVYCAPVNIHSPQWMWTSLDAFKAAGVAPATDWASLSASADALRAAGIQPLVSGAQGWQFDTLWGTMLSGLGGHDLYMQVYQDKDEDILHGDKLAEVFAQLEVAREMYRGSTVQDWNLATAEVIQGKAAAQVMGDWAQGEFSVADKTAGQDYDCLIGLGGDPVIATGGDAFYFPVIDDPEMRAAQLELASTIVNPETQVAFNLKKGSLPIRGDVDLASANACMKKGLEVLAAGNTIPSVDMMIAPDTVGQIQDLLTEFFASDMTAKEAQDTFADVLLSAW